jgi:hypothetical protein
VPAEPPAPIVTVIADPELTANPVAVKYPPAPPPPPRSSAPLSVLPPPPPPATTKYSTVGVTLELVVMLLLDALGLLVPILLVAVTVNV